MALLGYWAMKSAMSCLPNAPAPECSEHFHWIKWLHSIRRFTPKYFKSNPKQVDRQTEYEKCRHAPNERPTTQSGSVAGSLSSPGHYNPYQRVAYRLRS